MASPLGPSISEPLPVRKVAGVAWRMEVPDNSSLLSTYCSVAAPPSSRPPAREDFICLSEFGPHGPVVVQVVPNGADANPPPLSPTCPSPPESTLDLAHFVVAIMSVDPQPPCESEPGLLGEDTASCVPLPPPSPGQAYVHLINLHDIAARGERRRERYDKREIIERMLVRIGGF